MLSFRQDPQEGVPLLQSGGSSSLPCSLLFDPTGFLLHTVPPSVLPQGLCTCSVLSLSHSPRTLSVWLPHFILDATQATSSERLLTLSKTASIHLPTLLDFSSHMSHHLPLFYRFTCLFSVSPLLACLLPEGKHLVAFVLCSIPSAWPQWPET